MRFQPRDLGRGRGPRADRGEATVPAPQLLAWGRAARCPTSQGRRSPPGPAGCGGGVRQFRGPSPSLRAPATPTCQARGGGPRLPRPPVTSVPNSGTAPAIPGRALSRRRKATPRPQGSEDAEEGAPGTSPPRGGAWDSARGVPLVQGTRGRPPGFVCNPGSGRPAPRPRAPGGPGLPWLRPPLATRLPPAHLGSAPPPPPALCTPGSAGLCSALRGSSGARGAGAGGAAPVPARARRRPGLRGDWPRPLETRPRPPLSARPRRSARRGGGRGGGSPRRRK